MDKKIPFLERKPHHRRQVASLTKIMTFQVCLKLIQRYKLSLYLKVKINKWVPLQLGTSAKLKFGDTVTLKDLFYGMMLPSGNDAA